MNILMLDFSLNVVGDVDIIPRSVDVEALIFCCACCSVTVLDSSCNSRW